MNELPENFVVIDLETTGLDPERCGILEIGAVKANGDRLYLTVALERGRRVEAEALECNGIDPLDLSRGLNGIDFAIKELCDFLEKTHDGRWIMGGKNPQFDYGFLQENWPVCSYKELSHLISRRTIDLHSIAYAESIKSGALMEDLSIDDTYRLFDLEPEPRPHNALRGALHEMECFRRLIFGKSSGTSNPVFERLMEDTDRESLGYLKKEVVR